VDIFTCDRVDYDSDLVVYTGCSNDPNPGPCPPTDLELLACNDDAVGCLGFSSAVKIDVVAGVCYTIRVGGFQEGDQGTGLLNIEKQPGGPNNDLCANRRPIFNGETEFDTTQAVTDGPGVPCTPLGPVNDIWWNYTAFFTGDINVTTCEELNGSADFDTVLVVYDGCDCDPLSPLLGCNDDDPDNACGSGAGGFHSTVVVPVTAGNCYKIRLGGFSGGSAGSGILDITKFEEGCPECNTPSSTDKVLVCHRPPGNRENGHTICIEEASADEHLENHAADTCGPCASEASGTLPGRRIDVISNKLDVFVGITPDIFDDAGAIAAFARFYRDGDIFILNTPKFVNGEVFLRWNVTSGGSLSSYEGTRLVLPMVGDGYEINAIYADSSPTLPSGR
jgi:hypothetical protein